LTGYLLFLLIIAIVSNICKYIVRFDMFKINYDRREL
jgi:hypothetical protein